MRDLKWRSSHRVKEDLVHAMHCDEIRLSDVAIRRQAYINGLCGLTRRHFAHPKSNFYRY